MNNDKKNFIIISVIAFAILLVLASKKPNSSIETSKSTSTEKVTVTPAKKVASKPMPKPKELAKASESTLNETMHDLATQGLLTSEGLTKADIAYWALNTYGYDCEEVKSVKYIARGKEYLEDSDLNIESRIINPESFSYREVTCTSGQKLKLYKRHDYYPYIVEN